MTGGAPIRGRARARCAAATVLVALAAGIAAGCGSSEEDADFGADLDAACTRLFDDLDALPGRFQSGELELEQVDRIGRERQAEFAAEVAELDPPQELADRRDDLLGTLDRDDRGTDVEEAKAALEELSAIYADLGAEQCRRRSAEARARLDAVRDPSG